MQSFKGYLAEMANTDSADINEIQLAYFLSDNWKYAADEPYLKSQLTAKRRKVGNAEYLAQTERAKAMADAVLLWAKKNGYSGFVETVWWTARPGVLSQATKTNADSRKNPTDVLIRFTDKKFLGISAKSTKTQGDIGFKNPGLGTIENALGKFQPYLETALAELMKKHKGLSVSAAARKREIRANPKISEDADVLGTRVLNQIRDELYSKLSKMKQKDLLNYILNDWMDANEVYPPYIKVTGMRVGAKVEDPLSNSKISALNTSIITLSKVGNDSVGIMAGQKRIMKMRSKFESQKMASTIKFSGDPWK